MMRARGYVLMMVLFAVSYGCTPPAQQSSTGGGGSAGDSSAGGLGGAGGTTGLGGSGWMGSGGLGSAGMGGTGGLGGSGGTGGSSDPCANVVCDSPPTPCHLPTGICNLGICQYSFNNFAACDDGNPCTEGDICYNGICEPGTTCPSTAPAPICLDPNTMRVYGVSDNCTLSCSFPHADITCPNGCTAGTCNGACVDEISPVTQLPPPFHAAAVLHDNNTTHLLLDSEVAPLRFLTRTQYQWQWADVTPPQSSGFFYNPKVSLTRTSNGVLHGLAVQWQSLWLMTQLSDGSWQQYGSVLPYSEYFTASLFSAPNGSLHFNYVMYYDDPYDSFAATWTHRYAEHDANGNYISNTEVPQLYGDEPAYTFADAQGNAHTILGRNSAVEHWGRLNGNWQLLTSWPGNSPGGIFATMDSQQGVHVMFSDNGQSHHLYLASGSNTFMALPAPPALGELGMDAMDRLYLLDSSQLWRRDTQGQWSATSVAFLVANPFALDVQADGTVYAVGSINSMLSIARVCPW